MTTNNTHDWLNQHGDYLYRFALARLRDPHLAEDVVQESFIKAYERLNSFEARASFKSWLFQIAVNTARNKLRSRREDTVSIDELSLGVAAGAEMELLQTDVKKIIRAEVENLPERQKLALKLRIFEDLSFKEIAEIMACPYDTAKANYRHALMKLKSNLERLHALKDLSDFQNFFNEVRKTSTEAEQ